jgi:hypothetical protein
MWAAEAGTNPMREKAEAAQHLKSNFGALEQLITKMAGFVPKISDFVPFRQTNATPSR